MNKPKLQHLSVTEIIRFQETAEVLIIVKVDSKVTKPVTEITYVNFRSFGIKNRIFEYLFWAAKLSLLYRQFYIRYTPLSFEAFGHYLVFYLAM